MNNRTNFDINLQNKWCPSCNFHPKPPTPYESYDKPSTQISHTLYRTNFDINLQNKWCPSCNFHPKPPIPYGN